jgi:TBC1 domain family member 6
MTLAAMAADSVDSNGQYASQQDDPDMHKILQSATGGSQPYSHNHNEKDLPLRPFDRFLSRNAEPDHYQQPLPAGTFEDPRSHPQPGYYTSHDAPPQLPPLPMSPRWDYSFHKSKAALLVPSPTEQTYTPQDAFGTPSSSGTSDPSAAALLDDNYPYTITPPASEPEPRASSETTRSQNFSRPRKPSLKQPVIESPKPRQTFFPSPFAPPPEPLDDATPLPPSRPRGLSSAASSVRSASTFSTVPMYPSTDTYDLGPSRLRHARTAAPLVRPPPLPGGRIDSMESSYTRDMAPWLSADESRSSYRSQWSSAQGTWTTARSSVVTRDSSVHSVYVNPDEPSIEDVMGMYEKGFHDDSSPEDFDGPLSVSRENAMNKRNTRILEALERPLPPLAPSTQGGNLSVPSQEPIVRESTEMFRPDQPSSPLRASTFPDDVKGDEDDRRDSAKSLQESSPPPRQFSNVTSVASSTAPSSVTMDPEDPGSRDRYGFRKHNQYITREQYDAWDAGYSEYLDRRRKKWIAFQKENGLMTDEPIRFPPPSAKTKRFIRKGIPPDWRGAAWFFYAGGPFILGRHSGVYDDLLRKTARDVDVEAIERDLHRTFPDNYRFRPGNEANTEPGRWGGSDGSASPDGSGEPAMISSLRRVLRAFAIYNPRIGYCQSLNFLAGLLLLFLETEEQAFWLLNVITRVYLPGTHETNLEGSKVDLGVLMAAVRETMPAVWAKIGDDMEGDPNAPRPPTAASAKKVRTRRFRHTPTKSGDRLPPVTLCMTAWFMSCFIGTLPMETTLRVWDVFFYEGSKTLFRIALTIFKLGEAEIKAIADPMEMFSVVQAMPRRLIDANGLIEACFKRRNGFGHMSQDTIESQRRDRRNKAQAEREKAAAGGGASTNGNVTENEEKPRRKGTLFGRRPKKEPAAAV